MAVVAAEGLEKSFGRTAALRGVSVSVEAGSVLALVGPNGAGKTTLVRCLTGTTRPDAGRVRLFGEAPDRVEKARIGLLPQAYSPPGRLTARELVAYFRGLYDDGRRVDAVLEAVGVDDSAGTRYADLSGGQQRRVLVGTTLVNDPELLFLDEPTTGIDPAGRRRVLDLVADLVEAGTTVVLTTHSLAEVERLADRVGVLVDGAFAALATPAELVEAHGGPPRLVVEADPVIGFPELERFPDRRIERTRGGVRIEGVTAREIGRVVAAFEDAGAAVESVTWRDPDLESVYLGLTGEAPLESRNTGGTP